MQVAVLPASSPAAQKHFGETVATPVALERCRGLVDADTFAVIAAHHPGGTAAFWGSLPGGSRQKHWEKLSAGDIALFHADDRFFAVGTVTAVVRSPGLASEIWGVGEDGQTWELMFALTDVRSLAWGREEFNAVVGYLPKARVQGFKVLNEERSARVAEVLGADPGDSDEAAELSEFVGALDGRTTTASRKEQGRLRRLLTGGSEIGEASCALCGRLLPAALLWASHIKPRRACSDDEKRDLAHVAMLNCLLGCDALFERGWISVDGDGQIEVTTVHPAAVTIAAGLGLVGRACAAWTRESEAYFAWHHANRFLRAPALPGVV